MKSSKRLQALELMDIVREAAYEVSFTAGVMSAETLDAALKELDSAVAEYNKARKDWLCIKS